MKFYFRAFVDLSLSLSLSSLPPRARARAQITDFAHSVAAPGRRTPRRFANKIVPSRQMKPYRFSLLRSASATERAVRACTVVVLVRFHHPSIALGPRPTQSAITTRSVQPRVRLFPLCTATSLVSSVVSTCSLFPCHLLQFFVCYKGSLVRSFTWTYAKRYTESTIRSISVHLRLCKCDGL